MLTVLLNCYAIMFPTATDNGNTDMLNVWKDFLLLLLFPSSALTKGKGELPVGFNHDAVHTGC